jgi:hypothetical protein
MIFARAVAMSRTYRVMVFRAVGRGRDPRLHLVRDDLAGSLCGLPRDELGPASHHLEIVCSECIEWLMKRGSSSQLKKVSRPAEAK